MDGHVFFEPRGFPCYNYITEGREKTVTAIITPVKVFNNEDHVRVFWNCNHSRSCSNAQCLYSRPKLHDNEHDYHRVRNS